MADHRVLCALADVPAAKSRLAGGADPVSIVTLILVWSIAIGAIQLIPAIDHAGETSRARGFDFELITAWSFPPQRIAEMVYPHIFGRIDAEGRTVWWGGSGLYGRPASPFLFSIYLGGAMFALIAAGLAIRRTLRWPVLLFVSIFVIIALGRHIVVYRWLVDAGLSIPFRYPEKFVLSALFGLVVFGSVMFDRITDGDHRLGRVSALVSGVVCLVAVAIAISALTPLYEEAFTKLWGVSSSRFRAVMVSVSARDWAVAALVNGLAALLFWLRSRGSIHLAWAWGVTGLLIIDLVPVGFDASPRIQRSFYATPEIVEDLPARSDYRVFHEVDWYGRSDTARTWFSTGRGVYWVVRNGLYPMTSANHGIRTVLERDYDRTALLPTVDLARAMWEVRDAGQKQWAAIFMEMSNAGFRSRYRDRDRELQRVEGDFRHVRPIDFTEVPLVPRYYLAERLVEIDGKSDFVDKLVEQVPEPRTAFVAFEPFDPANGSVSVVSEKSSTIELDVAAEGRSFLVLSVTPHRYWRAEVDGREAELRTVNIGYQGLELEAGEHRVVMRYRNPVFWDPFRSRRWGSFCRSSGRAYRGEGGTILAVFVMGGRPSRLRIRIVSASMRAESRPIETREPSTLCQRTGTSATANPSWSAIVSASTSNANRSMVADRKTSFAAAAVKSLNPHCVSWNGSPVMVLIRRLKIFPIACRCHGWRWLTVDGSRAREPMTTSNWSRYEDSNQSSSSGVERSASEMSTISPVASMTPCRIA